ncbi:cation/H(+) antiporter 15-like [Canna indica]|uniref:Cation/H(+) antiporter 15-like n=1 Tax=Canna indica TaxID=4628 RepID=A0AAQ3JYL7_9LILI|nr:cation/H(+) antiporter 15-like [Canna indica]
MAATSTGAIPLNYWQIFCDAVALQERRFFCFPIYPTTSRGIWFGDDPIFFPFANLLYQICLVFILFRAIHLLLRRLHQPIHISQIMAGIILGPGILGRLSFPYRLTQFSPQTHEQLYTTTVFGYMLFNFLAGLKADINMIPKAGRTALAIAVTSTLLPVVVVSLAFIGLKHKLPPIFSETHMLLYITDKWCLTSFVVLATTLSDLNLLSSELGRLTLSAALISNVLHQFAEAVIVTYMLSTNIGSPVKGIGALLSFLGLVGLIVFVFRPIVVYLIRRTPPGKPLDEASFVAVILMALVCGVMSQFIGFEITAGSFFFGLVLPEGEPLGASLAHRMDGFVVALFMPMTFAMGGIRMHLELLSDRSQWLWVGMFLLLCIVTKFVGAILPCLFCNMSQRDTVTVGLMMISKGIYEVDSAMTLNDIEVINIRNYAALIIAVVLVGVSTTPLIKYLYRPEESYMSYQCRTLENADPRDELLILACVHEQCNVNPILTLLKASGPSPQSPICLYLLHLIQLVGRACPVLLPHNYQSKASTAAGPRSESDHIVNAFQRQYEQQYPSTDVSFLPFVCMCPYTSMHNDICSLALDKKVTLVILPFHQYTRDDCTVYCNQAIKAVNTNVLRYAPCSVGILIDNGLFYTNSSLLQRVAVYFFGGADDREALAYATRMADYAGVRLLVVRFLPPNDWRLVGSEESATDNEMLRRFHQERVDGQRVVYREEVVKDSEETVAIIRELSQDFSLFIVGCRHESVMMQLSHWSEYPELGIMGDLLASTNFGDRVSTLVVRQQVMTRTRPA